MDDRGEQRQDNAIQPTHHAAGRAASEPCNDGEPRRLACATMAGEDWGFAEKIAGYLRALAKCGTHTSSQLIRRSATSMPDDSAGQSQTADVEIVDDHHSPQVSYPKPATTKKKK